MGLYSYKANTVLESNTSTAGYGSFDIMRESVSLFASCAYNDVVMDYALSDFNESVMHESIGEKIKNFFGIIKDALKKFFGKVREIFEKVLSFFKKDKSTSKDISEKKKDIDKKVNEQKRTVEAKVAAEQKKASEPAKEKEPTSSRVILAKDAKSLDEFLRKTKIRIPNCESLAGMMDGSFSDEIAQVVFNICKEYMNAVAAGKELYLDPEEPIANAIEKYVKITFGSSKLDNEFMRDLAGIVDESIEKIEKSTEKFSSEQEEIQFILSMNLNSALNPIIAQINNYEKYIKEEVEIPLKIIFDGNDSEAPDLNNLDKELDESISIIKKNYESIKASIIKIDNQLTSFEKQIINLINGVAAAEGETNQELINKMANQVVSILHQAIMGNERINYAVFQARIKLTNKYKSIAIECFNALKSSLISFGFKL